MGRRDGGRGGINQICSFTSSRLLSLSSLSSFVPSSHTHAHLPVATLCFQLPLPVFQLTPFDYSSRTLSFCKKKRGKKQQKTQGPQYDSLIWRFPQRSLLILSLLVCFQVATFPGDFSSAVAGLIFLEYTASAQWSAELLVITFGGGLKSYLVR